jgi:flagellar motility protein MotE (MotC chaperone)
MNNKYPNLVTTALPDGFTKLAPIKGQRKAPPPIRWGEEYQSWGERKKRQYAERVASAMNHAADLLQKERDERNKIIAHKEQQIKAAAKRHADLSDMIQRQITEHNAQTQQLNECIVELQKTIRAQALELKRLNPDHGD